MALTANDLSDIDIFNCLMSFQGEGCYNSFQDYIIQNSVLVGGVGIGLAAFEVNCFNLFVKSILNVCSKNISFW